MSVSRRAIVGLVIAGLVAFWFLHDTNPRAAKPTAGSTIVAFGDAWSKGVAQRQGMTS